MGQYLECEICGTHDSLITKQQKYRHQCKNYLQWKYQCRYWPVTTKYLKIYIKHKERHKNTRCKNCRFKTNSQIELWEHMKTHQRFNRKEQTPKTKRKNQNIDNKRPYSCVMPILCEIICL